MTEITIVRHGQANSGARTETDYDRLSELGHLQARWLGEHYRGIGGFDRIVSGTLNRQDQTARALNPGGRPQRQDSRLNELDYFHLSQVLEQRDGIPFPTDAQSFAAHVPQVLELWRAGHAGPDYEGYEDFRARVLGIVADTAAESVLVLAADGARLGRIRRQAGDAGWVPRDVVIDSADRLFVATQASQ